MSEFPRDGIAEGFVEIGGEGFYVIPEVHRLGAFLMNIVSDSDLWMFLSSRGGLTAGRKDATAALFPYETEDRLHRAAGLTGPVTVVRCAEPAAAIWEPFREAAPRTGRRNLYKSVVGNQVIFEETHDGLGLVFRYRWSNSDRFGFVRTSTILNMGGHRIELDLVDGLLDLLPHGLGPSLYQSRSVLTSAYKRSEILEPASRLAVYSLESHITDRAEPAEALIATTAWAMGWDEATPTLDAEAVEAVRSGAAVAPAPLITGRPGAYLLTGALGLDPGEERTWQIVADVEQDQSRVAALRALLASAPDPAAEVAASIRSGTGALVEMMARSDALQRTGDRVATAHHFANVTYNVMRGGIFSDGYTIRRDDLGRHLESRNRRVAADHRQLLEALPGTFDRAALLDAAAESGDPQLMRLVMEYLPLTFSRRHGDPSRPWNEFSIRVRDERGHPPIHYEGNWRDIFQNWEALCLGFPEFLPSMIAVFVNASTPDGFNPYRLTRDGIDWEVPEPDDPWSNIGYWGDHQIVYLLRLLEAADRFLPGTLVPMLGEACFSYADVPYRIAPYEEMQSDPRDTIGFDAAAAERSAGRVEMVGGDGKLLWDRDGGVYLVTLIEKLVVPALSKLSNFVPGGGIWMNTQRPEWNDANNALAGYGLSMVTLYHLRRYLHHLAGLMAESGLDTVPMSNEVADWLATVTGVLRGHAGLIGAGLDDISRRAFVDALGAAFSDYRTQVYAAGFSGIVPVSTAAVEELCAAAVRHLDDTIRRSRRADSLFHSFNLVDLDGPTATIEHLPEMLEGQVAVLGAGILTAEEQADVLEALFDSDLFRPDQESFMLYPARRPPSFLEKNVVPPDEVAHIPLLGSLLEAGDRSVMVVDADGRHRFNAAFTNSDDLAAALDRLAADPAWSDPVAEERQFVLDLYERVFRHHSFTGRSGSMYGYEGIGSIYWHMVSKLLLAVQEAVVEAEAAGAPHETMERLIAAYRRVRHGLGFNKTAFEYGAFPTDPYSHTPAHAGAQQPGMTGQVKEELLTRLLEVGVRVEDGEIHFDPILLQDEELLEDAESWEFIDLAGRRHTIELAPGSLGLTLCQVPLVVGTTAGPPGIEVEFADGSQQRLEGLRLDRETSRAVFARSGEVVGLSAWIPESPGIESGRAPIG